jgi:3',5'-cyclic AMP phosphodiesterase CpdA
MRTVAHLSDLHFGRHDVATAEALLESLEQQRPDLVIVSGDLTQRARRSEFAQARKFLDRIGAAKLVVPGNHDVPLFNLLGRALAPFKHYEDHIAPIGPVSAFFADDEIAALVLNTARRLTRKNGRVSREQMTEIRNVFADMPSRCFKILATHHPLGEPEGGPGLELVHRSRPTLLAIAEAGVNVLLSGHHHRASSGAIFIGAEGGHSILVAHAGTAVSTRTRGSEGNSYDLIRLEPGIVTVAIMVGAPGCAFREALVSRYLCVANVWKPA